MTSEVNTVKTNDFLRRRKLRLQQVREQSKDIAKKIRQRAKTEELRQVVELDAKKQQEYFQKQEKLVKRLEEFYARGIKNVGASHKNANELKSQGEQTDKVDVSKQRGKEAAAELRRKRQETLDKQKKILDRKLQARETANEKSREKSTTVANKVFSKTQTTVVEDFQNKKETNSIKDGKENEENVNRNDMATQWEIDEIPNEWEPIPTLSLPKDDNISVKEFNNNECKSDKSKRIDLFALSEEMPSSLRGTLTNEERVPVRPSVTLVSEYLQSRGMRLRETDSITSKKNSDELQSLRQTIMKTRTSREGSNVCHVHDIELVPVPSWQAGVNCGFCHTLLHKHCNIDKIASNYQISRAKPAQERDISPTPILRGTSPFRRNKVCLTSFPAKGPNYQPSKASENDGLYTVKKKNSVTMYNHTTRDTRDIPYGDVRHVIRNPPNDEDAYSQAMKETTSEDKTEKDLKKLQDIRSKVAMTKQSVEKEYRETMSFLNSLPKDTGNKPIRNAYLNEYRQDMQRENRQRKMQQEYKNIAKECRKQTCRNKSRNQSKSPVKDNYDMDFQYSWMPVPESDENLAIHTIPTSVKEGRSNSVQFSKVDSYHEYRSRHKHTPPTKDTTERSKHQNISESDSVESDSTSEITLEEKKHKHLDLSDAERIIIYKILDSKKDRKTKKKLVKEIAQSLTMIDKSNVDENISTKKSRSANSDMENKVTFEQVDEGVYKTVNQNGDNIASMYFHDKEGTEIELAQEEIQYGKTCQCSKRTSEKQQKDQGGDPQPKTPQWESGDSTPLRNPTTSFECRCGCITPKLKNLKPATPKSQPINTTQSNQKVLPSAATSTSSFRTATTDKANAASDGDYIKLLDEGGQTGKFYIGASGLLKDDAYEVIIQLRKRGDERKEDLKTSNENISKVSKIITQSTIPEASSTAENTEPSLEKVTVESREIGIQNDTIASHVSSNETRKVTVEVKDAASEIILTRNLDTITTAVGTDDNENDITKTQDVKTVAEKGVSTSFQDSFAALENIPKSDSAPRPATSTYTQTSMSSPNHRPVFFHMSSSTSTAYMSPPDMILPKFLRQGCRLTDEDPRDYQRDSSTEDRLEEAPYCEYDCSCKKCSKERDDREIDSRKRKVNKNMRAPPNTARCTKDGDRSDNERGSVKSFKKKRKDKCRKCESRSNHDGIKSRSSKRSIPVSKHSSHNIKVGSSNPSSRANQLKLTKSNINPIVKKYVNKLLSLNRDTLKAVEVMDQDCSAVPTPGSSIINDNSNVNSNKNLEQKISLEQIKDILKQQILKECLDRCKNNYASMNKNDASSSCNFSDTCLRKKSNKSVKSRPSRKNIHKVKSLNISKHLLQMKRSDSDSQQRMKLTSSSSSPKEHDKEPIQIPSKTKTRSSSSPTPRSKEEIARKSATGTEKIKSASSLSRQNTDSKVGSTHTERKSKRRPYSATSSFLTNRAVITSDSDLSAPPRERKQDSLTNISTQTMWHADSELNFVKLAESKIQNMEKIADLTEKCTKRLSNLAKVLEEVRKNKSLAYSHMSSSGHSSDSEQKTNELQQYYDKQKITAPVITENKDTSDSSNYIPYLSDIPKPAAFKNLNTSQLSESSSGSPKKSTSPSPNADQLINNKNRARPPPALSRIHLKNGQDYVIPHELSTVIEVDSPLSVKLRNQGSRHDLELSEINTLEKKTTKINERNASPNRQVDATNASGNLMPDNCSSTNLLQQRAATESSDDSKIQMIELRKFNEIMLKPFFSIQEYAKRYNIETLDDGSNLDDVQKDDVVNDEMSSLHSDASLPDVISELLKRNLITEPFKFDTASNVNSTTISSESTLSVLALSRAKKEKKKSSVMFQNKENIGETSDTLSMSSNPDLENAFKKLGMGWASSTLKKTKERLALSSSSNTSSSSLSQFKIKSFSQDIPAIVTDTVSQSMQRRNTVDTPRNAEQQTSLTNTMTVKEFLTKELAKKITFDNKSNNAISEEFVSLFETKLPDEMQLSRVREENSIDNSMRSGNNRARTSTPVQLYKSMTYHSSSSSNVSNGLFSNADDLSSVKVTSNSMKHSTSDKDDLTIPNFSLKMKRVSSECSKSE